MQRQLDDGLQWCAPCDRFGHHTYCGNCGKRYVGGELTWRKCPNRDCGATVTTDWCPLCGKQVASDRLRSFEQGTVDLAAERERLNQSMAAEGLAATPDAPQQPPTLASAMLETFGKGRDAQ